MVIGGTAGTLIWPLLSLSLGPWLTRLHFNDLIWPYLISLTLLALSSLVIFVFLRPDPHEIARAIADHDRFENPAASNSNAASLMMILQRPGAIVAIGSMVLAQAVMTMVMVNTSLHMRNHNHGVSAISLTISLHVLGMFAFSILSGRLADKIGRAPVIACGAGVLIVVCLVASFSPAFVPITFGLFLLGLGWNFCFVGGSSLLADQLSPDERARTQGFNDLLMGLVAASGSFLSGHVFAALGSLRRPDRLIMDEHIRRGIGRAAAHEFAHQFLGSAPIHDSRDIRSYEYRSADRREQYYGDMLGTSPGRCWTSGSVGGRAQGLRAKS